MASKIKLKNANGNTLELKNNDSVLEDLNVSYFNTVEELTTAVGSDGDLAIVADLDRGGNFKYDSTKVDEDNQGTNFNGWIRQYSGAVNVKWFGAKGDGVTDDTDAIQAAVDYILTLPNNKGTLYFQAGIYLITDTIALNGSDGTQVMQGDVIGDGQNATFIKAGGALLTDTTKYMFTNMNTDNHGGASTTSGKVNWRDFTLQGNDTAEGCMGIYISDVSDEVNLERLTFLRFGNTALRFESHRINGVQDYGYYSVEGVNVHNCVFYGANNYQTTKPLVAGGQMNESSFAYCKFYGGGEASTGPLQTLLWIYSGLGVTIESCSFANTEATPLRLGHDSSSSNGGDIALMDDGVTYYPSPVQGCKIINNYDFEKVGVDFTDNSKKAGSYGIEITTDDGSFKFFNSIINNRRQFPSNNQVRLNNVQQTYIEDFLTPNHFTIEGTTKNNTFRLASPIDNFTTGTTGNSVLKYGNNSVEIGTNATIKNDFSDDNTLMTSGDGPTLVLGVKRSDNSTRRYKVVYSVSDSVDNGLKIVDNAEATAFGIRASTPFIPHSTSTGRPSTFGITNGSIAIRDSKLYYFYNGGWYGISGVLEP